MKRVLCYGDSNTYGTSPLKDRDDVRRLGPDERWPGILQTALSAGWTVVEEGLPGRTTVHDDPIEGAHKNGRTYLLPCLESHWPLDALVLMLGVNDLKARFALNPGDVAYGIDALLATIKGVVPPWFDEPRILLICPPPIKSVGWLASMYEGGVEKSRLLPALYRAQAGRHGVAFLDAGSSANVSEVDGIHMDSRGHAALARAVAAEIVRLVP